jgi:hypothetical protein
MLTEHYSKILDELTEWKIGVDSYFKTKIPGRPRKDATDNEASEPLKGYPVVLSLKKIAQPCEWCSGTCTQAKVYKRSLDSNLWRAKCEECGETRNIHTSQINFTK